MVGVINEPTSGNTLAAFAANAAKVGNSTIPPTTGGGAIVANPDSNSTSATSSPPSSTTTGIYGNPIPPSTSASSSPLATVTSSGAVNLQAVKWSELAGVAVLVGGAALVMQ
jgi:hypothetical protein